MINRGQLTLAVIDEYVATRPLIAQYYEGKQRSDIDHPSPSYSETPSKKPKNDFINPPLHHTVKRSILTVSNERTTSQNKLKTLKEKTLSGNPTHPSKPITAPTPSKPKIRHITIIKTANHRQILSEIVGSGNQRKFHARVGGEFIRLDPPPTL